MENAPAQASLQGSDSYSAPNTRRAVALSAWLGALLAFLVSYFALLAVDFDLAAVADPINQLAIGAAKAGAVRASMLCDVFGFYLLSTPLALFLAHHGRREHAALADFSLFCGLAYCLMGAIGAGLLSAVWPALIIDYASTSDPGSAEITRKLFRFATSAVYDGIWAHVEHALAALWLGGLAWLYRGHRPFALLTLLGAAANALRWSGSVKGLETLAAHALDTYLAIMPLWMIAAGVGIWRGRLGTFTKNAVDV